MMEMLELSSEGLKQPQFKKKNASLKKIENFSKEIGSLHRERDVNKAQLEILDLKNTTEEKTSMLSGVVVNF